ncbi:hypothetical protein LZ198_34725 [Myxococcus sp. K15C18031901]|uniref:hypothetical protein n=1 Tax=Myxococcus dinghuensis TaxID=2906761 RepID=UPI0020A7DD47|nr:hypothetical protein [Myxococcus dinghuensis]MCP3104042.1 hypothetical protein [Myxococcus dinghuensis]
MPTCNGMRTLLPFRIPGVVATPSPWRPLALVGAATLLTANTAALTLGPRRHAALHRRRAHTPRALGPRALPALALGAAAVGGFAVGALSIGALAIGSLAIGSLAVGRLRGRDWHLAQLRIDSLEVGQWTGAGNPSAPPPMSSQA